MSHGSAQEFLHLCPQSNNLSHFSVQCLRSGIDLHAMVIECPQSGIILFTYKIIRLKNINRYNTFYI